MEANLAVLIDFENVAAGVEKESHGRFNIEALLERIKDKGRVLIARAYADWGRFARYKQSMLMSNVTMIELTSHGMQSKNRADIAMVVEALELAFTKDYIDTFVIVSGDSDFTPMVLKMRELDKRIVGLGMRSSTSRLLIQACDEFIFYDSIVASTQRSAQRRQRSAQRRRGSVPQPQPKTDAKPDRAEALDLLVSSLEGLARENVDSPLASVVKTAMLRKSPDFSESDYGFSSFARFLEKAQREGMITLARDQKAGGYRVVEVDADEDALVEEHDEDESSSTSSTTDTDTWSDPYLPEGVEDAVVTLAQDGMNPLASATRRAILEAIHEVVQDRKGKKRRINVHFVQDDVRRRMRKSHPDVPTRAIKAVFNALMNANILIHPDGTPVRSGSAPFTLDKGPEEMNRALASVYVESLQEAKASVGDVQGLAQLLFSEATAQDIAWLADRFHEDDREDEDEDEDEDEPPTQEDLDEPEDDLDLDGDLDDILALD